MDKQLEKNSIQVFIPVEKIEKIVGKKLSYITQNTMLLQKNDPSSYNMAIERSLITYYPEPISHLPEELGHIREDYCFSNTIDVFLKKVSKKMRLNIQLPHKEQICFEGEFGSINCFSLHLSNTLNNELFISDIFLQNPNNPNIVGQTSLDYKGLGHGIFDEILSNIENFALTKNYSKLGLLASNKVNMEIFKRRGFAIEDNHFGEIAKSVEMSYPMVKLLK